MTATRQVALVTGASAGTGKAAAIALAAAGFEVIGYRPQRRTSHNAGVGAIGAAEELSVSQTEDVFDINVFGVMRMTKAVLPHMRSTARTHHQRLLPQRVRPQPVHGRLHLDQARGRGVDPARIFDRVVRRFYRMPS